MRPKLGKKGKLFVISAPSGSGKTTLCLRLVSSFAGRKRLVRSISVTTRKRRKGERGGKDYFFISRQEFIKRKKAGQFLEWATVLDNSYGTPRDVVAKHLRRGDDVLLSIDVQGARKIQRKIKDAVFIFILPPSLRELRKRLMQRSTEDRKEITRRLKLARWEMSFVRHYNYVVLNDRISDALERLKEIIRQERKG